MSEMKPSGPKNSTWFDRLIELGNHNKLIAAATLVTLATGVPYLVISAVGAFTGVEDDGRPAAISAQMIDMALAKVIARVEADGSAIRLGGGVLNGDTVGAAEDAVVALGKAAIAPAATPEETERIFAAFQDHAAGSPAAAYAEFERIGMQQEARGALKDAAQTWRRRGSLRQFTDVAGALTDLSRAETLAPGDSNDLLQLARLHLRNGDADAGIQLVRRSIIAAREEGDRHTLISGLDLLASNYDVSWSQEEASRDERQAALEEVHALLLAEIAEKPASLRYVAHYAEALSSQSIGAVAGGASCAAQLLEFEAEIERVRSIRPDSATESVRDRAMAELLSIYGFGLAFLGYEVMLSEMENNPVPELHLDKIEPALEEALEFGTRVLESPRHELADLEVMRDLFGRTAFYYKQAGESAKALEISGYQLAVSRELAEVHTGSALGADVLSNAQLNYGTALIEAGELDSGILELEESMATKKSEMPFLDAADRAYEEGLHAVLCAANLPDERYETALSWLDPWVPTLREAWAGHGYWEPYLADLLARFETARAAAAE